MITIVELVKFREGRYGKHARKTRNSVSEMIATVFASGSFLRCASAMQEYVSHSSTIAWALAVS